MRSRLLVRLDQEIAAAGHPVQRAALQARKAMYLGRQGQREEAEALIAAVRQAFEARPVAEVTAWVSLAEAVMQRAAGVLAGAHDRMRRAMALSKAINHPKLVPLCSAWLAYFEYSARNMPLAASLARDALQQAGDDHHVLARAELVVADMLNFANRFDRAKPWYAKVREHALAEGDDSMLSALMFNVAGHCLDNLRLLDAFSEVDAGEVSQALLAAESTGNYDLGTGVTSMSAFVPLQRALALAMLGKPDEARRLLDEHIELTDQDGIGRRKAYFYAERALCSFKLGDLDLARRDIELSLGSVVIDGSDFDDLACTHARLASVHEGFGHPEEALMHREKAVHFRGLHRSVQDNLLAVMKDLPAPR